MPRRSWQSFSTSPRYSSGTRIVALMRGSSILVDLGSGRACRRGCASSIIGAVFHVDVIDHRRRGGDQVDDRIPAPAGPASTLQMQIGRGSRSGSQSPSAADVSISEVKEASFSCAVSRLRRASLRSRCCIDREQCRRTRLAALGLNPGSGVAGRARPSRVVMVSPTLVSRTCLIEAVRKPISPGPSSSTGMLFISVGGV